MHGAQEDEDERIQQQQDVGQPERRVADQLIVGSRRMEVNDSRRTGDKRHQSEDQLSRNQDGDERELRRRTDAARSTDGASTGAENARYPVGLDEHRRVARRKREAEPDLLGGAGEVRRARTDHEEDDRVTAEYAGEKDETQFTPGCLDDRSSPISARERERERENIDKQITAVVLQFDGYISVVCVIPARPYACLV